MKFNRISALVFLLTLTSFFSLQSCTKSDSIQSSDLTKELSSFVETSRPNRSVGNPGHEKAFKHLQARLNQIAKGTEAKVYVHRFYPDVAFAEKFYRKDFDEKVAKKFPKTDPNYVKWHAFTEGAIAFVKKYETIVGRNLVLEIKGTEKASEVIYVGAHFDTISHDHKTLQFTPDAATDGADDNASAVAAALVIAKKLAKKKLKRTVRVVFFDFEEIFFLGSLGLAKHIGLKREPWMKGDSKTLGLFNLEMIGWSQKKLKDHPPMKIYARKKEDPGSKKDALLAGAFLRANKEIKSKISPVVINNGFDRSDNWSFWQEGIPSICITQDWEGDFNKNYHTDQDKIKNLNMDYLTEITKTTLKAIELVANQ